MAMFCFDPDKKGHLPSEISQILQRTNTLQVMKICVVRAHLSSNLIGHKARRELALKNIYSHTGESSIAFHHSDLRIALEPIYPE